MKPGAVIARRPTDVTDAGEKDAEQETAARLLVS